MRVEFWRKMPVWQGEGGGGAGGAAPPAGDAPPAGAQPPAAGDMPPAASAKWWEGNKFSDDHRKHLTASGLTVDDPLDALVRVTDMHRNAVQRLGKDPNSILDRPAKDQPVTEWMKKNRDIFGLPENADVYKIDKPQDWPKDAPWDTSFEAEARAFAFENGLSPSALSGLVGMYAKKVGALNAAAETELAAASEKMRSDLTRDWGPQADARMLRASQAAQAVAERAGLSGDQLAEAVKTLSGKTGDANVIKLFDTIAQAMGDDNFLGAGRGSQTFGTTPAEARQQLAQLRSPDGDFYKASAAGNSTKLAELKPLMERLTKIAAGGS